MFLSLLSATALAAQAAPATPPASSAKSTPGRTATRAEPLLHDNRGRPVINVRINERGPFAMIVDTAAQTSLIMPSVAEELHLAPLPDTIGVEGATGASMARMYPIDRFATKAFDLRNVAMPALPHIGSTNARGIVGMDAFAGRKLIFDRTNATFDVQPSSPPARGYVAHKGDVNDTGFLVIPLTLNGVVIRAVIDTGASTSMANAATVRALGWAPNDPRLKAGGEIRGATVDARQVRIGTLDQVQMGTVKLSNVPLIFTGDDGDAGQGPSILLGNDILNLLDAYAVDIGRAELQIRIPH